MNLTFTANEDHLLYKNNDTFIIQESIEKTCPFNLSDVLLNIAKRFDCGLFYDYDSTAQKHILRIDPVFAVRSGTQNINQYVDDIKSYKITDGIKIFASNNKSMRAPNYTELYYTDPTNQGNEYLVAEHSTNKELGVNWNVLPSFHT